MNRFVVWTGLAVIIVLAIGFAMANAGREVTIDFGLFALNGVPVTFVAFGGMVVGMAVVLVAGINADLKVRRLLRERHMEDRELAERGKQRLAESSNQRLAESSSRPLAGPGKPSRGETLLE